MENKKGGKGKIIAIVVIVLVVIAAVLCWASGMIGGISEAEAKAIAYEQVPGAADDGSAIVVKEFDDMRKTYEVQFTHEGVLYEFKIAARNGRIIGQDMESTGAAGYDTPAQDQETAEGPQDIGVEKAKEIALSNVSGASASDVKKAQADNENGKLVYEIEIRYDGQEYDFEIDAATGDIVSQNIDPLID